MLGAVSFKTLSKLNSINLSVVLVALFAQRGQRSTKSSLPVTFIQPKPLGRTVLLVSHRFLRCRWSVTPLVAAIYRLSAVFVCHFMTGIVTYLRHHRWFGASKPTYQNQPIGTTLTISSLGAQTCRKRGRQMRISLPKYVIKARKPSLSPLTMQKSLSSPTYGSILNKVPMRQWRRRFVMSLSKSFISNSQAITS